MAEKTANGAAAVAAGGDLKAAFLQIYGVLKEDLLRDPAFDYTDESREWIEKVSRILLLCRKILE